MNSVDQVGNSSRWLGAGQRDGVEVGTHTSMWLMSYPLRRLLHLRTRVTAGTERSQKVLDLSEEEALGAGRTEA